VSSVVVMISPAGRMADSSSADGEENFVDRLRSLFRQPLAVNAAGMT
jgi:hypothetical protein